MVRSKQNLKCCILKIEIDKNEVAPNLQTVYWEIWGNGEHWMALVGEIQLPLAYFQKVLGKLFACITAKCPLNNSHQHLWIRFILLKETTIDEGRGGEGGRMRVKP